MSEHLFALVKEALITVTEVNKLLSLSDLKSPKCLPLNLKVGPQLLHKAFRALCGPAMFINPTSSNLCAP